MLGSPQAPLQTFKSACPKAAWPFLGFVFIAQGIKCRLHFLHLVLTFNFFFFCLELNTPLLEATFMTLLPDLIVPSSMLHRQVQP